MEWLIYGFGSGSGSTIDFDAYLTYSQHCTKEDAYRLTVQKCFKLPSPHYCCEEHKSGCFIYSKRFSNELSDFFTLHFDCIYPTVLEHVCRLSAKLHSHDPEIALIFYLICKWGLLVATNPGRNRAGGIWIVSALLSCCSKFCHQHCPIDDAFNTCGIPRWGKFIRHSTSCALLCCSAACDPRTAHQQDS